MGTYTGTSAHGVVLSATLPADNDDLMAADVNVPFEVLLDNDAALLGDIATVNGNVGLARAEIPVIEHRAAVLTTVAVGGAALETLSGGTPQFSTVAVLTFTAAGALNDVVAVDLVCDFSTTGSAGTQASFALYATQGYGGGSPATAPIPGAISVYSTASAVGRSRLVLTGMFTVTTAGTVRVTLVATMSASTSFSNLGTGCLRGTLTHKGA